MKKSILEETTTFIENHFKAILVILCIVIITAPIIVWVCYALMPNLITTDISADGMLGYIGSVLSGFSALLVAFIALWQGQKNMELTAEEECKKRRSKIKPRLHIEITNCGNDIFSMRIKNIGDYATKEIYLFEYGVIPLLLPGKETKKGFSIGNHMQSGIIIDKSYCEELCNGLPKQINLIYSDIDNNMISEEYKINEMKSYELLYTDYV